MSLSVVMILFLQLATTVSHNRMARTEFFVRSVERKSPRAAMTLEGLYDLLGATACGLIAWSTVGVLGKDLKAHEFIGVLGVFTLPVWPFRVLIIVGATAAALHYLLRGLGRVLNIGQPAK